MKTAFAILFTGLTVLILGCGKSDETADVPPPAVPEGDIWPLEIGNTWAYLATEFDSTGAVRRTYASSFDVLRTSLSKDREWFDLRVTRDGKPVGHGYLLSNEADGLWHSGGSPSVQSYMVAKYPASAGETFPYAGDTASMYKVISADTSITVPSGTYRCLMYRVTYSTSGTKPFVFTLTDYYCPGVGWVKSEKYRRLESGESYLATLTELQSLTLNRTATSDS